MCTSFTSGLQIIDPNHCYILSRGYNVYNAHLYAIPNLVQVVLHAFPKINSKFAHENSKREYTCIYIYNIDIYMYVYIYLLPKTQPWVKLAVRFEEGLSISKIPLAPLPLWKSWRWMCAYKMPFSPTPEANWKGGSFSTGYLSSPRHRGSNRISWPDIARSIYLVSKASLPVLWHVTIITCSTSPVTFQCLGASETLRQAKVWCERVCMFGWQDANSWMMTYWTFVFADLYMKPDMMIPDCPVPKDSFSGSNVKLRNCRASWSF